MNNISIIKCEVENLSPLYIRDGEYCLLDDSGLAYIPATGIAGAFRAYLQSIGENSMELFGDNEHNTISKIYISDSYSKERGELRRRDRVKIDPEMGSYEQGAKVEELYLNEGLKFELIIKIQDKENVLKYKNMIYKCLSALKKSYIRFGGNKSNGLGIFKINKTEEIDFNLRSKVDLVKYLKKDYSQMIDAMSKVEYIDMIEKFVEFTISGELSTPLIIANQEMQGLSDVNKTCFKSGNNYVIPGSSFKGVLRSRIEQIANYFNSLEKAKEMFGDKKSIKSNSDHILSRVFINEAIVDSSNYSEITIYNRIKIDKFTGGVQQSALFRDTPVKGKTEFKIIYRKDQETNDNYSVGIIALALRDLGTENLPLGAGNSIGRGRFKANSMKIKDGHNVIEIDFNKKIIKNEEKLNEYIDAVKGGGKQCMN